MRLIDADAVLAKIEEHKKLHPNALPAIIYAELLIAEASTIDSVEHGQWIPLRWRELTEEEKEYYGEEYTAAHRI